MKVYDENQGFLNEVKIKHYVAREGFGFQPERALERLIRKSEVGNYPNKPKMEF